MVAALTLTLGSVAGCGLSPQTSGSGPTLTIASWKGYGADLPWAAQEFKRQTGASLRFQYVDSEQDMLALVKKANGGIDVALPNLQYVKSGIGQGLFTPLDTTKLTNYKNIYPTLSNRGELRDGGRLYAVPWVWGSDGIFYNSDQIKTPPSSWSDLWADQYKGRVGLYDDPTILVPVAGLHLGQDPQAPNMTQVAPALQQLASQAKLTSSSVDDLAKAISNKTVVIGVADSGSVGSMTASGLTSLRFVLPKEGGMGWADNWAIAANSKHQALAYQWLNFMTSPAFLSHWANDAAAASPAPANQSALTDLTPTTLKRLQARPALMSKLHLQLPEPADRLQSWIQAWQKAKAG